MKKNRTAMPLGAVAASAALHAVILSVSFVPWPAPEIPSRVSVSLSLITEPLDAARPPEPEPDSVPQPVADARATARGPVVAPPLPLEIPAPEAPAPGEDDAAETPPEPEPSEPVVRDAPEAPPIPEPAGEPRDVETPPTDVDWEEESRRAAREVVERRARDSSRRTFSFEDVEPERPAPLYPEAGPSVFDSPSRPPSLLSPGKQRSRAGRWLADMCSSLTGGVGVFGIFGLCTDEQVRNDLFASIKPDYLKARPVCTEVADAVTPDGTPPKKTHDCRLVVRDE